MNADEQRAAVREAREHAAAGRAPAAAVILARLACIDRDACLAYDVRMRWHEVVGVLERGDCAFRETFRKNLTPISE